MSVILAWDGNDWHPVDAKAGAGIYCELDDEAAEWVFSYGVGEPLVSRRTALRRANEIAKVGYVLPGGDRVGTGLKVREEIPASTDLPERLRRAQRDYNKKHI
ncbi:MAG TPA: hypothetical protein VKK79_01285 [Candidatus Lokiarchaeia archaeon]|nr:hypothetical protein [Candidatus Lokiarchaeia archaeon]